MGFYLTNAVIDGLEGMKFATVVKTSKTGKKKPLNFNGNSLAMLAVIASGQSNPDCDKEGDTIFHAPLEEIGNLAHIATGTVDEMRHLLLELGLIRYYKCKWHRDLKGSGKMKMYHNVYQIAVPKIRELNPEASDEYWRTDILKVSDEAFDAMNASQRAALALADSRETSDAESEIRHAEKKIRHAEKKIRNVEKKNRNVDTNIYNINKKDNNIPMVVAFGDDGELNSLINRIATACGVDQSKVDRKLIRDVVSSRDPAKVDEVVSKFKVAPGMKYPVRILYKQIECLPEHDQETLKKKNDEYQTRPVAEEPEVVDFPKALQQAWEKTVSDLRLEELPQDELNGLHDKFESTFTCLDEREEQLGVFVVDLKASISKAGGDTATAMPNVDDRVKHLESLLAARHNPFTLR